MLEQPNARKHFEAVIQSLSKLYDIPRAKIREWIKCRLKEKKVIKESTKELTEEQLKLYANHLSAFYFDQNDRPPEYGKLPLTLFISKL